MAHRELLKDLILPYELKYEQSTYNNTYGKFFLYPFDKGVGVTIANSLRRILLSAIPGYSFVSVKIDGVNHEFDAIPHVKEDVTDIVLALKRVSLFLNDQSNKKTIFIEKSGPGFLTAGDFQVDASIEIANPDLKIATLGENAKISLELDIEFGRGYRSAEDALAQVDRISVIPIDAIFSPVDRVNFFIEEYRVGEKTDCEKIVLEVWTGGTINPADAVADAAFILKNYFSMFINFESEEEVVVPGVAEATVLEDEILSKTVESLDLSVRSLNCLQSANIVSLGQLITYSEDDLMKIKNFGKKSLTEIAEKLAVYNLTIKNG
ncbi:MAG: DNA-directed RNA polymerase subunit alpha [Brevinemataceae bacterium]